MTDLVRSHTDLDDEDVAWLQLLQADWQIIADLSFADLVLWLPDREGKGYWAAGQMRPTTGPTAYVDDVIGTFVPLGRRPMIDAAYLQGRLVREGDPEWRDDVPVRVETIPVRRAGRIIAVVARNTNLLGVRTPSRLELSYLQTAADLTQMIANGHFPAPGQRSDHADSPRVGDGFLRVDAAGKVVYASPNALSVYRRLGLSGDLAGVSLPELTRELVPPRRRPDEETLSAVLGGRAHRDTEIGTDGVSLIVRAIPLRPSGDHIGALILVRDVTDLRRRDRELVTKDATIREIHHRVKNNLQTVAALLRLQARRIDNESARLALEEAVRRVGSIAIVHETLSQAVGERVDFDEIVDPLGRMVTEVSDQGSRIRVRRDGGSGCCPPRPRPRWRWCSPSCSRTPSSTVTTPTTWRSGARSCSRCVGWSADCTSRSTTTEWDCPRASTWTGRRTSGSRSSAPSWSRSSEVSWNSVRCRRGRGPEPPSTYLWSRSRYAGRDLLRRSRVYSTWLLGPSLRKLRLGQLRSSG
jgi:hypothetical protein